MCVHTAVILQCVAPDKAHIGSFASYLVAGKSAKRPNDAPITAMYDGTVSSFILDRRDY